jgi:hypothetical protein
MKRHGNLFGQIITIENLRLAYKNARRGKNWQSTVQSFDRNAESNLMEVQRLLTEKRFVTSAYKTKIIFEPKRREIFTLPFSPDRIVHHALMNVIEPIWEGLFIHDSYACRKGKGIHAGSRRIMEFIRRNAYCLKCDISRFYPSMDQDVLFGIVQKKIKCKNTLWLFEQIIYSLRGGKNVPIGNYTSQWLGNLYLNELDQVLKHRYKIRDYIRYCDDFLLFHESKRFLWEMAGTIKDFIAANLKLTLSKCDLFPVRDGVDFLGYRHFRHYVLLRKSSAKRMKRRIRLMPLLLKQGKITKGQFRSSLASISGWLRWANTHHLSVALNLDGLRKEYANAEAI